MITNLRRGAKSPLFIGILALIAFAFIFTSFTAPGSSGLGGGIGAQSLASVDGADITVAEVTDQAERRLADTRTRQPDADINQLVAAGGIEEIVTGLVSQKALRAFAEDLGMVVSKALVDGQIASMPAFFDLAGKFSQDTYQAKLQTQRVTDLQLRDDLASTALQRQLLVPVGAGARVPQGVAAPYAAMLLERRSGIVGVVPTDPGSVGPAPTAAALAAYYAQNRAHYVVPERRILRYALIGPDQARAAPPTDAEIATYYQANAATYAGTETHVLSQVVLPAEAAARGISARIAGGESFAAAAATAGFAAADISIGPQDKAAFTQLTSAAVANAVFALPNGGVSAPIQSPLGWHVVKVDEIRNADSRPLALVRNEIAARLATEKSTKALEDLVAAIDDQIADGASFADVVAQRKLPVVQTPAITASGLAPGLQGYTAPPELAPLLANAFQAEAGEDPTVDALPGNAGFAMVVVDRIVPAAPPPLASIQAQVAGDLRIRQAADRARATATAIVAAVNRGAPMARAFADAGVRTAPPRPISAQRLEVARGSAQIPPPIQLLFSLPKGRARLLPAPGNAGFFVVYLADVVPGDAATSPGLIEATRSQFSTVAGQEYVEQFVAAIEGRATVRRNSAALATLKRQLDGTAARTR